MNREILSLDAWGCAAKEAQVRRWHYLSWRWVTKVVIPMAYIHIIHSLRWFGINWSLAILLISQKRENKKLNSFYHCYIFEMDR